MDDSGQVADLLRKALVVATKLGLNDFRMWILKERDGYSADDELPSYRHITGHVMVMTHPGRYVPALFPDAELTRTLSGREEPLPLGNPAEPAGPGRVAGDVRPFLAAPPPGVPPLPVRSTRMKAGKGAAPGSPGSATLQTGRA